MIPKISNRYRESHLSEDIKHAKLGIWLLLIPLFLFIINDYWFFGLSEEFLVLNAFRLGFIVYTIMFLAYLASLKSYPKYLKSEVSMGPWRSNFPTCSNSFTTPKFSPPHNARYHSYFRLLFSHSPDIYQQNYSMSNPHNRRANHNNSKYTLDSPSSFVHISLQPNPRKHNRTIKLQTTGIQQHQSVPGKGRN